MFVDIHAPARMTEGTVNIIPEQQNFEPVVSLECSETELVSFGTCSVIWFD